MVKLLNGKRKISATNHTDTLDIHMQEKMKPDPYLTPHIKVWYIKDIKL